VRESKIALVCKHCAARAFAVEYLDPYSSGTLVGRKDEWWIAFPPGWVFGDVNTSDQWDGDEIGDCFCSVEHMIENRTAVLTAERRSEEELRARERQRRDARAHEKERSDIADLIAEASELIDEATGIATGLVFRRRLTRDEQERITRWLTNRARERRGPLAVWQEANAVDADEIADAEERAWIDEENRSTEK
jgi:hypothetical protein